MVARRKKKSQTAKILEVLRHQNEVLRRQNGAIEELRRQNGTIVKTLSELKDDVDKRFCDVDKRFDEVDKRFDEVDKRFDEVDKRFDGVDKRFDGVDQRLGRLEDVARTHTRELKAIRSDISGMNARVEALEKPA